MHTVQKSILLAGFAAMLLAGVAAPAAAVPMKAVYTGTVIDGVDVSNAFGVGANTSLAGQTFSLTFLFDSSTSGTNYQPYNDGYTQIEQIYGGSGLGNTSPVQSATLTINGVSQLIAGSYYGQVYNFSEASSPTTVYAQHYAQDYSNTVTPAGADTAVYDFTSSYVNTYGFGSGVGAPFPNLSAAFTAALLSAGGYFGIYNQTATCNTVVGGCTISLLDYAYGNLNPTGVSVSQVSAVPIPAALPLLATAVAGFAAVNRRRQKRAA
jgi:hypothetical protein